MLTAAHCDLFDRPFFQFAQLKQHQPDSIEAIKANYKAAWQDWQTLIKQVAADLGSRNSQFAAPHIERWCNGWQVRAHFFAYFKYAAYPNDAPILSVLLNRRRLTVSLDWHCYKADRSTIGLAQYRQWQQQLDKQQFAHWHVWRGRDSEYADHATVATLPENAWQTSGSNDFLRIGCHLDREHLAQTDCQKWLVQHIEALLPLYESCFR